MSRSTLGSKTARKIATLRKNYTSGGIRDEELPAEPVSMFRRWIDEAVESEVPEPNAMSLATVSENGQPNVRVVLLKGIEGESIQFYTNYNSRKGKELEKTSKAAVAFWWPELERQVRIRGEAKILSRENSELYFASRPRDSKISAWVSDQSSPVKNREELKQKAAEISARFEGKDIPMPDYWGGYTILIKEIEFWQGRPGRLHDRIFYEKVNGKWTSKRLQP